MIGVDFLMDLYYANNPVRKSFDFTGAFDVRLRLDINFPQWILYIEVNGMGGIPMVTSKIGVRHTDRQNSCIGVTWKR